MSFSRLLSSIFVLIPLVFGVCICISTIFLIRNTINTITTEVALQSVKQLTELSRIHYLSGNFNAPPQANRPVNTFVFLNKNGVLLAQFGAKKLSHYETTLKPTVLSLTTQEILVSAPVYLDSTEPSVYLDSNPVGFINVVFKIEYENKIIQTVFTILVAIASLIFLLMIPMALFLANKITTSLRAIVENIKLVTHHDRVEHEFRIDNESNITEINELIKAFNYYIDQRVASQKVTDTLTLNLRQEAEKNILDKSEMIAAFSHEMRIPLHIIYSHAHLLEGEIPFIESTALSRLFKNRLDIIIASQQSLLHRVENILAVFGNDRVEVNSVDIELCKWCANFAESMRPLVDNSGNQFDVEIPSDLSMIRVDGKLLEQILIVIIDNACKFTRDGVISFKITRSSQVICFLIKDTGPGISLDDQQIIFNRFIRKPSRDGIHREGLGVGLFIAHNLIRALGGEITLESQQNSGCHFYVTIPLKIFSNVLISARSKHK